MPADATERPDGNYRWASTWKTNWFETKDGEDEKLYGDRQDGVPMLIKASKT